MSSSAPIYSPDFFSDEFIRDPLPRYAEMRAMGPVLWLKQNNAFAVTRFNEVVAGLRNTRVFRSGHGVSLNDDINSFLIGSTLHSDDEEHDCQRAVTAVPIMPKSLASVDQVVTASANALADQVVEKERFDGIVELAQVLPLSVVVDLVGLNDAGKANMLTWAGATFNLMEGFNARSQVSLEHLQGLQMFLKENARKEALAPGGLARRIFEVAPEHGFSDQKAAQLLRDYIAPSLDTTISAVGFAAYYFAKQPEQWERLRAEPELIPNAIEEVVRLATPIRALSRYVAEDVDLGGVLIPEGSRALMIYASANRDETVFVNPDEFDVARNVRKHIGFGHGKHACMGMHLARLEMRRLIEALVARVKHWHLDGAPEVAMNNIIRAFSKLPLRIDAVS